MHMAAPLRRPAPTVPAAMIIALVAAVVATMAGCGSSDPLGGGSISGDLKSVVVGSADFPESKIVAEIYAQALATNGFTVRRQFGIGSRETYIPALQDHSIDLIPDYTGNLLQHFDPANTVTGPDTVSENRSPPRCQSCSIASRFRHRRNTSSPTPGDSGP